MSPAVTRQLHAVVLGLVAVFLVGPAAPALAQVSPPGVNPAVSGEQVVGDMLLRRVIQTLADDRGENRGVRADQTARAQVLLDLAAELLPDDAQVWTMKAQLARRVGDGPGETAALRQVVRLRPDQDAHRLRLVLNHLAEIETLDGRLAVLEEEIFKAEAESLSDAYRSRIASSAAAIAQEIGNTKAFLRHLKTAVRADPANGEAAMLTYRLAVEREAKPLSVGAAAMNVVRARPLDSDARLLLADALYRIGAHERALEQFDVAAKLPRATPLPPTIWTAWTSCLIAVDRKAEARQYLDLVGASLAQQAEASGVVTPLPIELELRLRLIHGDTEPGRAAVARITDRLNARIASGDNEAALELAWITALYGEDTDAVTGLLEGQDRNDPRYLRATGLVYLREGADRWARQSFEQIAETDGIAAFGLAVLQGRDEIGRARFVRSVFQNDPAGFGGLLAADKLNELGRQVMPGPDGQAMLDAMSRLPITLWRYDIDRNPWVSTRARFDSLRSRFLEPINAEFLIQNGLDIPLPIDPQFGVANQAFVTVSAFSGGQSLGQIPPMVIEASGRLTLRPRERLPVDVRIDRSLFGLLLTQGASSTLTYNTTFTSDPRVLPNGALVPGPLGSVDTVRSLQGFIPELSAENLNLWSEQAVSASGLPRYVALNRLASLGDGLTNTQQLDPVLLGKCVEALIQAFENGSPIDQALIIMLLNRDLNVRRSPFQPILDQAQRSPHDLVQVAFLMRHVKEADGAALTAAIRDGSPAVRRFAEGHREVLQLPPRPTEPSP